MKEFFRSTWFYLILLLVLALPLCLNLLGDRLVQGHDALGGFVRALCMERYWGEGQFLIRWSPDVNYGYGSPILNYYPPFFYYVTLLLSKITQNTILAMNLTCLIFWILSGVGMYLFAREFWGNKGGFLSALLYVYFPYHVQDFYVRGAFSEFSAFMVFPFLLFSLYKISQKVQIRYIFLGVMGAFASILTHGMGTFFLITAFFYVLFLFLLNKDRRFLFLGVSILLLGFMMSAFYWLPALWDAKYSNLNFIISMRYDFHKNFISLGQLFSFPWDRTKIIDGLSFQIGLMQLVLLFFSLIVPLRILGKNSLLRMHYFFFLIVGFIAIVLTLPVSKVLWEHINTLRFLQFPWRFLTIVAFAVSLVAGSSVMLFKKKGISWLFLGVVSLFVILSPARYYWPGNFEVVDQTAVKNDLSDYPILGEGEPTPKWVIIPPTRRPDRKFEIVHGNGQLGEEKAVNPIQYKTTFQAVEPCLLCFHTFYFPGWRVYMDGKAIDPYINNPFGLILFLVPPGSHDIQVVFGTTPVRITAMIISWIGFILLIGWVFMANLGKLKANKLYIIILSLFMAGFAPAVYAQTDDVSKYITLLKSPNPDIRMSAAEALGAIKDLRAVKPLIAVLNDDDKGVRRSAARTLGFLRDPSAVEPLIAVLKDQDPGVRRSTVDALAYIKDPRAAEPLIAVLKDVDPQVREDAVTALGKMRDIRAYDPLDALRKDPDINVRKAVDDVLGVVVSDDKKDAKDKVLQNKAT